MSAPGYQSWAWTQQDWRTVQLHADGSWSYDRACGDGSTLPSGRKRLCLPRAVLDTLARSAEGRRIVREQAQRKQGAKPGTRVQWHPKIRSLVKALDARTPADRKQRRNPMATLTPVFGSPVEQGKYAKAHGATKYVGDYTLALFRVSLLRDPDDTWYEVQVVDDGEWGGWTADVPVDIDVMEDGVPDPDRFPEDDDLALAWFRHTFGGRVPSSHVLRFLRDSGIHPPR